MITEQHEDSKIGIFSFSQQSIIQNICLYNNSHRVSLCLCTTRSVNQIGSDGRFHFSVLNFMDHRFCIQNASKLPKTKMFQWVNKIKHAIIWIMLFKPPVGSQFDTVMLASYVNYVNNDHHKCGKRVELSRFVAWLTSMSAPFPPHAIMALEDKWVAPVVMTHNVMACPLQWAKPIFSYCVSPRIGIGTPQAIYSRVQQAKGMWRANVF